MDRRIVIGLRAGVGVQDRDRVWVSLDSGEDVLRVRGCDGPADHLRSRNDDARDGHRVFIGLDDLVLITVLLLVLLLPGNNPLKRFCQNRFCRHIYCS